MHGLNTREVPAVDLPANTPANNTRAEAAADPDQDRRRRSDRRRTPNPVFEARARRVGMALDRRQQQTLLSNLRRRLTELVSGWFVRSRPTPAPVASRHTTTASN